MSAPDLRSAMTNELTLRRISALLHNKFNLPEGNYELVDCTDDVGSADPRKVTAILKLHLGPSLNVKITFEGPVLEGELVWGLRNGPAHVQDTTTDGIRQVNIEGYLRSE